MFCIYRTITEPYRTITEPFVCISDGSVYTEPLQNHWLAALLNELLATLLVEQSPGFVLLRIIIFADINLVTGAVERGGGHSGGGLPPHRGVTEGTSLPGAGATRTLTHLHTHLLTY